MPGRIGVGVGVRAEAADRVSLVGAAHGVVLREKRHVVRDHLAVMVVAVMVVAVGVGVAVRVGCVCRVVSKRRE